MRKQLLLITLLALASLQIKAQEKGFVDPAFKPKITFGGVAHMGYDVTVREDKTENGFNIARVCGLVKAELLPNVNVVGLFYFAPTPLMHMHELYASWKIKEEITVTGGLKKVPITLANQIPTSEVEGILPSMICRFITGGTESIRKGINTGRDMGIEISGNLFTMNDHPLLEYKAGIFNGVGTGIGSATIKDNNPYKDYAVWLYAQPIKGLKIGGSALTGKISTDVTFTDNEGNPIRTETIYEDRTIWSVGGVYENKYMRIRSEYISAQNAPTAREGYYALGVWKANKWLEVIGMYDHYNERKELQTTWTKTQEYNLGFTVYFNKWVRLRNFYTHSFNSEKGHSNTYATQVQLLF